MTFERASGRTSPIQSPNPAARPGALSLALIAWVTIVIIRNAWLSDDAFISFRTVQNFVSGLGLTWNPGQRVQSFTHPAWFFVVSAAHALTHEMYYTAIALSAALAALGLWIATRHLAREDWNAWPVLVALGFSRSFVDYSTSGLENVLSHLLLVWTAVSLVRAVAPQALQTVGLDLGVGVLALNRVDLTLMVAPAWAWVMWRRVRLGITPRRLILYAACACGPLCAWWAFSIFYFGFALPNTAYAKLGVGLTLGERSAQGFFYVLTLISTDPAAALLLASGFALALRAREGWQRPLLLGAAAYVLYVLSIGGDFMAGRFFSAPLVVAAATLLRVPSDRGLSLGLCALFALAGWAGPAPPPCSGVAAEGRSDAQVELKRYRIVDERRYYHEATGLLTADRTRPMPNGVYRDALELAGKRGVAVNHIGMRGFLAGPDAALIDRYALTDPFLARLPFPRDAIKPNWKVGHFVRSLPEGYITSVKTGDNRLKDPKLARFYDAMQLITTGPLWSAARFQAIWRLNTGALASLTRVDLPDQPPPADDDEH